MLTPWKRKNLSFSGRLCLLNSVLSSIPRFYLSSFKSHISVANKISSLQQRFLLEGSDEVRKISWVKWEDVCRPKKEGGMGVRDVTKFNISLFGKWRWKVLVESESLWAKVICAKYG